MKFDVFISHASEDKDQVATPLAHYLRGEGLQVWIDEFELTVGDSLRRSIDRGLSESKFGIVILSPNFLDKVWTNRELDGLVAREDGKEKFILPVWHNVTNQEVLRFSPTLAGKLAVSTNQGIAYVAKEIIRAIQREVNNNIVQVNTLTLEDRRAKELSELRSKMLTAHSRWDLRQVFFETEEFLTRYPNNPEARLLKERLLLAIKIESEPTSADEGSEYPMRKMSLFPILTALFFLTTIGLLLFWLIKWLLGL